MKTSSTFSPLSENPRSPPTRDTPRRRSRGALQFAHVPKPGHGLAPSRTAQAHEFRDKNTAIRGFQDRLFVTLGLRRDFASAIGTESSAIWYPKASLAVRLDQFGGLPR